MPDTTHAACRRAATDAELMRGIQANDARAFGELYDRHSARAWHVARAVCHDASRAEDAVQEGFLAVWRSHGSYRGELGSVQGWLMTIVRNRAIDAARRESARHRPRLADRGRSWMRRPPLAVRRGDRAQRGRRRSATGWRSCPTRRRR